MILCDVFQQFSSPYFSMNFLFFCCPWASTKIQAWQFRNGKTLKSQYFKLSITLFKRFDFTTLTKTKHWAAEQFLPSQSSTGLVKVGFVSNELLSSVSTHLRKGLCLVLVSVPLQVRVGMQDGQHITDSRMKRRPLDHDP